MRIVFWQNIISPHQVDLFSALKQQGHEIILVVQESIDKHRSGTVWDLEVPDGIELYIAPGISVIKSLFKDMENIHVFSGFLVYKYISLVFLYAVSKKSRVYIYSEYSSLQGAKKKLNFYFRSFFCLLIRYRVEGVLAIGENGVKHFSRMGFSSLQIFEFAYFVSVASRLPDLEHKKKETKNILFVGRFVPCKGINILLKAFSHALKENINLNLVIVGDGEEKESLLKLEKELKLTGYIDWHSFVPRAKIFDLMSKADLLVLPNTEKEGWGVVVNEAQANGVAVVCTEYTGASSYINESFQGEVIKSGDIKVLAGALLSNDSSQKDMIISKATRCLSPMSGALYLSKIFFGAEREGIIPPWKL